MNSDSKFMVDIKDLVVSDTIEEVRAKQKERKDLRAETIKVLKAKNLSKG